MFTPSLNLMNHHVMTWKLVGLWHWDGQPRFYTVYIVCTTILFYVLFPLFMAMQFFYTNNIFEIVDIILFLPTALSGFKAFLIVRKRTQILEALNFLRKLDQQITNDAFRQRIQLRIDQSRRFIYTLGTVYYTSVVFDYISALMNPERIFIWVSWFPFDATSNLFVYHATLIYQFVATLYVATIVQSIDVFGGSIYCLLGGHLDVLGERMLALGSLRSAKVNRGQSEIMKLQTFESMLNDCIETHHHCVNLSLNVNEMLSIFYIFQFGISIMILCTAEYKVSMVNVAENPYEFLALFSYTICAVGQVFVPCYCASIVTHQSELLPRRIFYSNWVEQTRRFKSSILIFVERAKRPIIPKAGGLFEIGLPIFVSIMKTGYSMFAFLKKMGD